MDNTEGLKHSASTFVDRFIEFLDTPDEEIPDTLLNMGVDVRRLRASIDKMIVDNREKRELIEDNARLRLHVEQLQRKAAAFDKLEEWCKSRDNVCLHWDGRSVWVGTEDYSDCDSAAMTQVESKTITEGDSLLEAVEAVKL